MQAKDGHLPRAFYAAPALEVARAALGMRLVHLENGRRLSGIIVETEAYGGADDLGCHARAGLTPRTKIMFGAPGHAYVYFTYGMHWLLNLVVEAEGRPAAVLIRALLPDEGQDMMAQRRAGVPPAAWTDGPAKLCRALGVDGKFNGHDLCSDDSRLFLEEHEGVPDAAVQRSGRIGLNSVPEPWKSIPWRFYVSPEYRA